MANVVEESLGKAYGEAAGTPWARNYGDWYFRLPAGVHHDEAPAGDEREREAELRSELEAFMASAAEVAQRAKDRLARWDVLIERRRLEKDRLDRKRKQQR